MYAETEPNNGCSEAEPVLAFGIYTGLVQGSSSSGDRDYYSFDVPANGTLEVTIHNNTNKILNYSELRNPFCPTIASGSIGNNASTLLTIPSTLAGKYFIYLEGDSENVANAYNISARFTPNDPSEGNDLKVTKIANVEEALIYDRFYYTVSVSNIGNQNATDVNLTDTLPDGMSVDLDMTNGLTSEWDCRGENNLTTGLAYGIVKCTLDGELDTGEISIFRLHVRAPSAQPNSGVVTNTITVESALPDVHPSDNTFTETTGITNEKDTAEHLCYTDMTPLRTVDYNSTCEMKGNFYYGSGCEAYVAVREYNATTVLSDIKLYKMYAPETKAGSCDYIGSTSGGAVGDDCNDISHATEYGSYTQGYAIHIDHNLVNNIEVLLHDSGTYNTPRIDGIAMFGDYYTALGFHHKGRIYECNGTSEGGVTVTSSADLIDTPIDGSNASTYNAHAADVEGSLKYIQTMVAGMPSREVTGVHLNLAGEAVPYETLTGIPYSIVPYMSDDTCSLTIDNIINPNTGQQLVLDILPDTISAQNPMIVPTSVSKASRMRLIFVDPNSLSVEGQNCLANSSTTGNFARLAQCVNSEVQYKTAFGQDAWDRCGMDGGKPCDSANNGFADPSDPTYDPATDSIYVNQLGCYMCTFNIQPSCTTDNFAIRPDHMDTGMTSPDAPDLLRAGKEYPLSLIARYPDDGIHTNGSAIPTDAVVSDYTVNDHNYNSDLESVEIRYFKNGQPDTEEVLEGNATLNTTQIGFMVGGLSSQNLSGPSSAPNPDETVAVSYTDVGTIMLNIYDKEWAAVDNDDTPMDCNTSRAHTYICTYDMVTFIPHHFSVDNIVLRNHNDGNFTYLSNDLNMSAHMDVTISALNAEGNVTRNFREGELFYENPVSVDLNVTEWNPSLANKHPLNNDTLIHDIPNELLLGFGGEGEANGTRNITWNDSNLSHRLMFNYQRYNNQPLNPFRVPESDVNISVASTYTASGKTAVIIGTGVETDERNATFYFGRAKASKDFYDVKGTEATTPITALVYCDIFPTCTFFPDSIQLTGQTNLNNWWLSLDHNENTGDGSITLENPPTLSLGNGSATVDTDVNIIADAQDSSIQVERTSGSTTAIFDIFLNTSTPTTTHSWMIYNANSPTLPPDPFYKVRFTGDSGWAGVGETGHVLDVNASTTKTKRLNW
ncbi:DUF6701 domain-containing protein [Sulfurovum mangrovi]|uniref:DUF6701 domain-containing protein n=1 Tax=Sulfurovum mangrovi TaxID=2893889 RepID=UPI001E394CE5|nr:DUF6701 domain-containing protein [Sulfurovum mangrovi]UFH58803.1 DUF11 domain-containing protein [Sulfurovum mangrovi]